MDKEKIKNTLAGIGIAGLITSVSLITVGCSQKAAEEEAAPADADTQVEAQAEADTTAQSSCGQGSCSGG